MRYRPEQHLRRQSDIRGVREQGRRVDCRAFTLWWHRRGEVQPVVTENSTGKKETPLPNRARACFIASTAAVGAATKRNRAKRRLREIFRKHQHLVPPDCDLLLIARGTVLKSSYVELEKKFSEACGSIVPPVATKK
jgi:ribonuclease P protein component